MSMFSIFSVSGSAISAQSQRLNVVASNLAQRGCRGRPRWRNLQGPPSGVSDRTRWATKALARCQSGQVSKRATPLGARCIRPEHPLADEQGYVTHSNVSAVDEMVDMISASRSYQNNVEVMNTAKTLLLKTLQLGQ